MKNILVTGGCGFIGSHLIKMLVPKYKVVNIDLLTYAANMDNLKDIKCKTYIKDISDPTVDKIIKKHKIDTIINLAASTHVDRSIIDPSEFIRTDINGVFNLMWTALHSNIERFIHISTDEVLGDNYQGAATENFPLDPNSPYASSKACSEMLIRSYIKTYNAPAIIIRPCNNYGTHQYPEKLIPMSITRLMRNKKIFVHGKGEEIREWIHVEDCCRAIIYILENGNLGEVYHVGSGERYKNIDIVKAIIQIMKSDSNYEDHIEYVVNRPGNDRQYWLDCSKFKNMYSDFKQHEFQISIKDIIDWYCNNTNWWNDVDISANIYKNDISEYFR